MTRSSSIVGLRGSGFRAYLDPPGPTFVQDEQKQKIMIGGAKKAGFKYRVQVRVWV